MVSTCPGFEDPRLFGRGGELYLLVSGYLPEEDPRHWTVRQFLARLERRQPEVTGSSVIASGWRLVQACHPTPLHHDPVRSRR